MCLNGTSREFVLSVGLSVTEEVQFSCQPKVKPIQLIFICLSYGVEVIADVGLGTYAA